MDQRSTMLAARGLTDDSDRLLTADAPLADLHERCGGELPGTLAVPELLDLVQQGREMGLRIAREFSCFDGDEVVSGFVRVHPLGDEDGGGCEVLIDNWQRAAQPLGDTRELAEQLDAIDRAAAEVTGRLNARQQVQLLDASAADVEQLKSLVAALPGRSWTSYVDLQGVSHQQPLHWRLLDGATCTFAGSERSWRVRIIPVGPATGAPRGFEWLLIASEPYGTDLSQAEDGQDGTPTDTRLIGSTLTPVLRQPIARIIANAETIRARLAGPLRAEYSEYAGNIATAGQHLSAMLDDLADLEVVEAADFATIRERVDLGDAARRAAGILGVRAQARGIALKLPPEDERCGATAEFRRVLQILINLIGNAIAYSPEGSTVAITLASGTPSGTVAVTVADQGAGISAEQASRIFEKFERLGRDNDGGSGLGLYISQRLARAMAGELSLVQDEPGDELAGAQFRLTLPAG